ncbi:MAG: DUF427 domain-containing protein [Geodermatophilaceae bacterium]
MWGTHGTLSIASTFSPAPDTSRLEVHGTLLADSSRPTLLFEALLPTRCYLPRKDVRAELIPSEARSCCAYKGHTSYLSPPSATS